ncbi:ABC transporter ATP-binding protein [Erythrobacter sp. KMU-140]|uniref:ABC transporter ATP-binding protein n=1 Tax=Erythrobacter rubeus TaxID=2760803 RepID=A0ABR8KQ26_9SPHN|nr:ABC transporter ATP-binding protein [Erythrobacter rubeus]
MQALEDISFTAPTGEITCLLGSSGCGKSTLLNLAAGLLPVQQGSIRLGDELLAEASHNPPPEKRPVGMVFQDGALFPHMTIAQNIGFGLGGKNGGTIDRWLDHAGLGGLGARYPHELSGGQQQRAALARAMAPGPQVLLMDEPFASVDIVLRRRLRRDCRILLREQGATSVLVTHDPSEALDIADRIAVMEAGRIVQFGTPDELHRSPAAASVGAIFGGAQVVPASREGAGLRTAFGTWLQETVTGALPDTAEMDLLLFANALDLAPDPEGLSVRDVHPVGDGYRVLLSAPDGQEITVETVTEAVADKRYKVTPKSDSVRAFART